MPDWYFDPYSVNGGFNTASGSRIREGGEMQKLETLARERLDNTCDVQAETDSAAGAQHRC